MLERDRQHTIRFFQFIRTGRPPERADRSAGGTLHVRAFRYCEAVTTATALGYNIFPPGAFSLFWTGTEILWSYPGADEYYPLEAAQFPDFEAYFDETADKSVVGCSPPFLAALPEPGIVQVWSGLFVQTKPGWSILARGLANFPRSAGYDCFEGVIESDRWFGPLFINIRLSRSGSPIIFDPNVPLFQVQLLDRCAYSEAVIDDFAIQRLDEVGPEQWDAYRRIVIRPRQAGCPHGQYATDVRKRRSADAKGTDRKGQEL